MDTLQSSGSATTRTSFSGPVTDNAKVRSNCANCTRETTYGSSLAISLADNNTTTLINLMKQSLCYRGTCIASLCGHLALPLILEMWNSLRSGKAKDVYSGLKQPRRRACGYATLKAASQFPHLILLMYVYYLDEERNWRAHVGQVVFRKSLAKFQITSSFLT
eukprot:g16465.t1